ncbi:YrrS family protein [Bacillus manliponensis]|uniref:YrrS family protein n=1 Tax=Bacillus manliponensis TaxID=574376 RepID=UPI0035179F5A
MAGGSRFEQKQQKRRQNGFLNIAIGIVLFMVVIVAYQLLTGGTEEQVASDDKKVAEQTTATGKEDMKKEDTKKEKDAAKKEAEVAAKKKEKEEKEEKKKQEEEEKRKAEEEEANKQVEAEKTLPEAKEAYTKSSWKPVGTEQGESPAMTFQKGSTDWNEMIQAISSAIDVPADQLILHRVGNSGQNKAYGNVQDKQTGKKYYVNIDWIANEGWKPVLVQTLN